MSRTAAGVIFALLSLPGASLASERWRVASFEEFAKGELENVIVSATGEVRPGLEATQVSLPAGVDASLLWSTLETADGTIYLGTGSAGSLLKYSGGKLSLVAKTDALVLSALADAGGGAVYAGSLPEGKIYKIDSAGKVSTFSDLEAEHVWALLPVGGTLYAATGPKGALYAIDSAGKSRVVYDSAEEHLLSLAQGWDGALLAGTAKSGLLLKITPEGKATALWDFEGQEVKAIRVKGDEAFVAVNTVSSAGDTTGKDVKKGGGIYRVSKDGRVESIYDNKDTYFTDLELTSAGLYASSGTDGKVYLIDPVQRSASVAFDVPERQVLGLKLGGKTPVFACGDAATLYRVSTGIPKTASYFSKVMDAKYSASFGRLHFAGRGKFTVRTRSGNTADPDVTWSDWSAPQSASGALVASPGARYLQVRVDFGADAASGGASLSRLDVYYEPQNQRPALTEIKVEGDDAESGKPSKAISNDGKHKVSWKSENPDGDTLHAYLWYKAEGEPNWKPLNEGKPLAGKTDYTWETDSIPDGLYQIKVKLSDAGDQPSARVLSSERTSDFFLVDNSKPAFSADLAVTGKGVVGKVEDGFSPIRKIEYSVDGGDWSLVAPDDGVFDDRRESFSFTIEGALTPGAHTVAVRGQDAAGNVGLARKQFEVK